VKPLEITSAIARLEQSPELADELVRKGAEHIAAFPGPEELARRYFQVFLDAVRSPRPNPTALRGVYEDKWTAQRVVVTFPATTVARNLEIVLSLPGDSLNREIRVAIGDAESESWDLATITRGESQAICRRASDAAGYIQLIFDPTFQPYAQRGAEDYRLLGCVCESALILSSEGTIDLLSSSHLNVVTA
jgi:hypothetical protein